MTNIITVAALQDALIRTLRLAMTGLVAVVALPTSTTASTLGTLELFVTVLALAYL